MLSNDVFYLIYAITATLSMLCAFNYDMVKLDNLSRVSHFLVTCQGVATVTNFIFVSIQKTRVSLKDFHFSFNHTNTTWCTFQG